MNNKIKTIDLFAGCGGLMDGFEACGLYETLACVEWEKTPLLNLENRLRYKWGYKDANERVFCFDIRRSRELIFGWDNDLKYGNSLGLRSIIGKESIDVIIGGPPCQAYSLAGRISDKDGMRNDYRNYLFESYTEIVSYFKPKAFIFENVPGILSSRPNGRLIVDEIREKFESANYVILENLKDAVINFSDYGVPQERKRVIILGLSRDVYPNAQDLLKKFYFQILPKFKVKYKKTVMDAISDLPKWYPYRLNQDKIVYNSSESLFPNHIPRKHNTRDVNVFNLLAKDIQEGNNYFRSINSLKELYTSVTGKNSNVHKYHVLEWNKTSNLIPAHLYKDGLRHIHPDPQQSRTITVREAARLQTFDDDYYFEGSQSDQFKMIGNAVSPHFSNILAIALSEIIGETL